MTVQEQCCLVDALLSELEQSRQKQALAELLDKRVNELEEVETPFLAVMSSLNALREREIVADSRLPDSTKATERIAAMRQQLADAPQDITKGAAFSQLCRAIKTMTERCEELAISSWNSHVKTSGPVIDKNLLEQHRDSPRHSSDVLQLEQLLQDVKALVKKPPPDTDTLQQIEQHWEEMRRILSTLPVSDNPEVQAFLNAAVSGDGAALDLLTESVRQWLVESKMLSDFCIRRSK